VYWLPFSAKMMQTILLPPPKNDANDIATTS
jgi:hypothetical protein